MSFGVVQSAITSMKNNRSLLSKKKDRPKNTLSCSNDKPKPVFLKSTPRMLYSIKQRLEDERRRRMVRVFLVFGFVISVVVSIFVYLFL